MASSSTKRPVPQVVENKVSPIPKEDSDSGGRRHVSSSVPRTSFTPRGEKEALNKLKKKMTFSDYSASSSAKSTPTKVVPKPHTAPHKLTGGRSFLKERAQMDSSGGSQKRRSASSKVSNGRQGVNEKSPSIPSSASYTKLPSSASYTKVPMAEKSAVSSSDEGEVLSSSVTISSLLSKLDSIKSFLKEAEEMRKKFLDRKSEPGMLAELNKLDKLVEQLQEQESGYLGEILRLMNLDTRFEKSRDEYTDEEEEEDDDEEEEEEEEEEEVEEEELEEEEEEGIEGRTPARGADDLADASVERSDGENESLSLRAQMELEQEAKLQLLALREQKEMLTHLLEKQKQIQDLEAKQADLLEMKAKAEEQLREAERKGLELQEEVLHEAQASEEVSDKEGVALLTKLAELKEKKKRMEQISKLLRTEGREEEGMTGRSLNRNREQGRASGNGRSVQATRSSSSREPAAGRNEMVTDDSVHSMDKLIQISREASSARKNLREAGNVLKQHAEERERRKDPQQSWKKAQASPSYTKKVEKKKQAQSRSTGQDASDVERSLVLDYEAKLVKKKEEVLDLLKEREELKATHKRLLSLQKKMNLGQFLTDSNADHDVYSQTDVTGATWGGSTVQSDPEEDETSSTSLPYEVEANVTQDSLLNVTQDSILNVTEDSILNVTEDSILNDAGMSPSAHGDGATIEQLGGKTPPPSIMVTRHTPRVSENIRPRDASMDSPQSNRQAKKIKMEESSAPNLKHRPSNPLLKSSNAGPSAASLSSKGGNMFASSSGSRFVPTSGASAKDQPTPQATPLFTAGLGYSAGSQQPAFTGGGSDWGVNSQQHMVTLQSQLALTSTMCTQLLDGQNSLIKAVCRRLDQSETQDSTQEQMTGMQQYQLELEAYYHQLCDSYIQLKEQQEEHGEDKVHESEEPVTSAAVAELEEGTPARHRPPPPPMPSAVSFQMEPTDNEVEPGASGTSHPWSHPHLYATASSKAGESEGPGAASVSYLPPPPLPLSGSFTSPGLMAGDNPLSTLYSSPRGVSGSGIRPSRPFQFEQSPPVFPGMLPAWGYSNPPQFPPAWPMAGRPPFFYPNPMGDPGNSFDLRRQYGNRPVHLGFNSVGQSGRGAGFGTLGSPSGVTASSLQVNAPSSPTSVPSGGMQQGSENASNDNQETGESAQHTNDAGLTSAASNSTVGSGGGGGGGGGAVSGTERKNGEVQKSRDEDVDSMSSLPMSVPSVPSGSLPNQVVGEEEAPNFSVFDSLRDTIYSEVATLIANNENRPHFLVEIFRELQMLSTDYLRQRALYSLQDLVTRFLTEETAGAGGADPSWLMEESASESDGGSSVVRSKPVAQNRPSQAFDYVEPVHSASSVSTPTSQEPFVSDSLGETVIRLDRAMARLHVAQGQDGGTDRLNVSGEQLGEAASKGGVQQEFEPFPYPSEVDTQALDGQIKDIMVDVIPLLKSNIERDFDAAMKTLLVTKIMDILLEQEKDETIGYFESFRSQVLASLTALLNKYNDRKLKDCGEDMLMDVSEVLFNELMFLRVMQQTSSRPVQFDTETKEHSPGLVPSSQQDEGGSVHIQGGGAVDTQQPGTTLLQEPLDEVGQTGGFPKGYGPRPLDPALLQLLSASANLTLQEEEDSLGKVRDDNLATMWDPTIHSHDRSMSDDLEATGEQLSSDTSQSKSHGNGSVEVYAAIGGVANGLSPGSADKDVTSKNEGLKSLESESEEIAMPPTPPTPVASKSPASTPEESPGKVEASCKEEEAGIGMAPSIGKRDNDESETDDHRQPPLSPIATSVSLMEPIPKISTMSESALESRMKVEQQQVEGVDGVLAAMKEHAHNADMELVGDEMTTPVNGL